MLLIVRLRERHHAQEAITILYLLGPVAKETLTQCMKDSSPFGVQAS